LLQRLRDLRDVLDSGELAVEDRLIHVGRNVLLGHVGQDERLLRRRRRLAWGLEPP